MRHKKQNVFLSSEKKGYSLPFAEVWIFLAEIFGMEPKILYDT